MELPSTSSVAESSIFVFGVVQQPLGCHFLTIPYSHKIPDKCWTLEDDHGHLMDRHWTKWNPAKGYSG